MSDRGSGDNAGRGTARAIPFPAVFLGAFGAVPFVGLAGAAVLLDGPLRPIGVQALAIYGAIILSFMGGVHWGLAIAGFGAGPADAVLWRRLTISVVPALLGWAALLVSVKISLAVLAAGFALLALYDANRTRAGEAPAWYPRLRWPLSLVVVASLLIGVAA